MSGNTGGGRVGSGEDRFSTKMIDILVPRRETGSCFDTSTNVYRKSNRAGGHARINENQVQGALNSSQAFDISKTSQRQTTREYLKKGTGDAGASGTFRKRDQEVENNKPKGHAVLSNRAAFERRPNPPNTELRKFYERGDLPIQLDHRGVKNALMWKVDIDQLDYHHYLPIFIDGLREIEEPYKTIAFQGTLDLLRQGGQPKVLPVIPQLIIPLKTALNTRDKNVLCVILSICQQLILATKNTQDPNEPSLIAQALVPYYRQLLPVCNLYKNDNENLGDKIQYGQQKNETIGELVTETLELFEYYGGSDAFINIKYLIPTYESIAQDS